MVGGGHSHLQVLRSLQNWNRHLFDLTLISEAPYFLYSGMIPGALAGDYEWSELKVNLVELCKKQGYSWVQGLAVHISAESSTVTLASGETHNFDLLSVNVGSKSLVKLTEEWQALELEKQVVVRGGGAAGFELAVAFARQSRPVSLVLDEHGLLPQFPNRVRMLAHKALIRYRVKILNQIPYAGVVLEAISAKAPVWFKNCDWPLDSMGFLKVEKNLLVMGYENIFAAGDCIHFPTPIPKSGVYAVKQGAVLARNIKTRILNQTKLRRYKPQAWSLSLLVCGDHEAILSYGPFALCGKLFWILKDWIDRHFLKKFQN